MRTISHYVVTVCFPGYSCVRYSTRVFTDERRARDYYTDMLLRYPYKEVKLEKR